MGVQGKYPEAWHLVHLWMQRDTPSWSVLVLLALLPRVFQRGTPAPPPPAEVSAALSPSQPCRQRQAS